MPLRSRLCTASLTACLGLFTTSCAVVEDDPQGPDAAQSQLNLDSGGTIVYAAVAGHQKQAHGTLNQFPVHYPLHVTLRFKPTQKQHSDHVVVGLATAYEGDLKTAKPALCQLGDMMVSYSDDPTTLTDGYHEVTREFQIPENCMVETDADGNRITIGGKRTFHLWVAQNPALRGIHVDNEGVCRDDDANCAEHLAHENDHNLQIFNPQRVDTDEPGSGVNRNDDCSGPSGESACVFNIDVVSNDGVDLEMDSFALQNDLGFTDTECDVSKRVHKAPLLKALTHLRTHGVKAYDDSKAVEEDELPAAHPGNATITYSICPVDDIQSGECAQGTSHQVLWVAAGNETNGLNLAPSVDVTMPPGDAPGGHYHQVFSSPEVCANLHNDPAAKEDWSTHHHFQVKACTETTAFNESSPCDDADHCDSGIDATSNNCRVDVIELVRPGHAEAPPGALTHVQGAGTILSDSAGNSVLNATVNVALDSAGNTSSMHSRPGASLAIGGWTNFDIFRSHFNADTNVDNHAMTLEKYGAVLGLTLLAGLETNASVSVSPPKIEMSQTWEKDLTRECSVPITYGLPGIGLSARMCSGGKLGFKVGGGVASYPIGTNPLPTLSLGPFNDVPPSGTPQGFENATSYGEIFVTAVPSFEIYVEAIGTVSAAVIRGGITGHVSIIKESAPLTGHLRMAKVPNDPNAPQDGYHSKLNFGLDCSLSGEFLSGSVSAYAERWELDICFWCDPEWRRFWSTTLFSFQTLTVSRNLFDLQSSHDLGL